MKIFYRAVFVFATVTMAFLVSGKNHFFHLHETPEAMPQQAQKKAGKKNARYPTTKNFKADTIPGAVARVAGVSSVTAVKAVDKASALPGDTLTYTVTITNNGSDTAKSVSFTDQVDVNTTALPDSFSYSPVALDDTFSCIGNVGITVPGENGVLLNDQQGSPVAALNTFSRATSKGGFLHLTADGGFDYTPAAGFVGLDTIQYQLWNGSGADVGVIRITITEAIWFINNNSAASVADGRLATPFKTVAAFQIINNGTGNNPKAGQAVFLYESNTAYNGNITLLSGQKLIGQDAAVSITSATGFYLPPYSKALPAMAAANGVSVSLTTTAVNTNAVTLSSGGTNYLVRGLSIGNKTGKGIAGNNFGTLTVAETNISGSGQALDLTTGTIATGGLSTNFGTLTSTSGAYGIYLNGVSGTLSVSNTSSSVSGSTTTGIFVSGGTAAISFPGSITGTRPVDIQNTTGSTIAFSGNVSSTSLGINIAGNTNSTITFSGTSKSLNTGANQAVSIGTNTGSTIAFTNGGMAITTTTANGFHASGVVGSLSVTGAGNTITVAGPSAYTGGVALNVVNATIGAGGLVFQSIASTNAQKGIVLTNTGATGGLTITGTGTTAGTGGTIQNTQSRGIEISNAKSISLSNINLTNANQSNGGTCTELDNSGCNAAVYISGTTGVVLKKIVVNGTKQEGVNLNNVTDLNMDACSVTNSGDEVEEGALKVKDLKGNCFIQNSSFTNSKYRNAHIMNTSGALTLKVANCDFTFSTATVGGDLRQDCFEMRTRNSATATLVIDNSQFKRAGTKGIQLFAENTSAMTVAVTNCTVDRMGGQMAGIEVGSNHSGTMKANVDGNPVINGTNEIAVNVYAGGTAASKTEATVRNNAAISGFGNVDSYTDPTVQAFSTESAKGVVLISGNTISQPDGQAILSRTTEGAGTMDATLQSNGITIPAMGFNGIEVVSGSDMTAYTNKNCSYLLSNTITNNGGGLALFVQAVTPGTAVQLQQKSGTNGGSNVADVAALWSANTNTGGPVDSYIETGATMVMGTPYVCLTPSNLVLPTIAGIAPNENKMTDLVAKVGKAGESQPLTESITEAPALRMAKTAENPAAARLSGETVSVSGVNLPQGKMLVVKFKVKVNMPFPVNVCSVSNVAEVSGSNFTTVNSNTAVTSIHTKPVITGCQSNINATSGTCQSLQSFAVTASGCPAPAFTYTIIASGQVIASPYAFPVGTTTVKAKATNVAGSDSCTFTVTVTGSNATWTGTTSSDWNTASNWSCGFVPDNNTNVYINSGPTNMPVLSGNGGANDIVLGTGATLTVNNGAALEVKGDFTSTGSITANGTVSFSGTGNQTIPAATYNNISITNGGQKTASGAVTINGTLNFVNGFVVLQNHQLTLGASGAVTGASAASFIVTNGAGAVRKLGLGTGGNTGSFVFPVGTSAASYTPATLSNSGTPDNFSIRALADVYHSYTGTVPNGSPISNSVVNKTWFVDEETAGGSNVSLTLQWNAGDELTGFNRMLSYVAHNTGTAWLAGPMASAGNGTEAGSYTRTWTGLTSFSPFGVGSTGSALPVQLLTFKGSQQGNVNKLEWISANESLQRYEIERATGQAVFVKTGEVIAGGGIASRQYTWYDQAPAGGANHYRLRLVHADGTVSYSTVVTINRIKAAPVVSVYPTPVTNGQLKLQLANLEKGTYAVKLYSNSGQLVYSTSVDHAGGTSTEIIRLTGAITKGLYVLQMKKNEVVFSMNVLIQ